MWDELKLLIIEDNLDYLHDLKLIFEFIGEECICVTSESYRSMLDNPETLLAVVLGQFKSEDNDNKNKMQTIIDHINNLSISIPLLLLFSNTQKLELNKDSFYSQFLGKIEWPTGYINLLDVLHRCQLFRNNQHIVKHSIHSHHRYRTLVGNSHSIRQVRHLISQVAGSDATVLILGESGTGKEVVAQHVHEHSNRSKGPFVPVNCGAIPSELLESELFGHEKGAFTGAITARQGRFELAKGGTLFLDEIGDLPLNMQVKLLRVLQEKKFERVGSNKMIEADVRIIAATNCDLETAINNNKFREDLYYRLNVFPIEIPPLSERREDIPLLINDLLNRLKVDGKDIIRLMPRAITTLCNYAWPGNIRELANLIERLVILYPHGMVDRQDLPKKFMSVSDLIDFDIPMVETSSEVTIPDSQMNTNQLPSDGIDLKEHLNHLELVYIKDALHQCKGVVAHAAERLNMRRTTLVEKMRKYGIERNIQTTN